MDEFRHFFKDKKNLLNLLVLVIIALSIPITVQLVRQQQIIKSRAVEEPIEVINGPNILPGTPHKKLKPDEEGNYKVELKLTSPLGPPP